MSQILAQLGALVIVEGLASSSPVVFTRGFNEAIGLPLEEAKAFYVLRAGSSHPIGEILKYTSGGDPLPWNACLYTRQEPRGYVSAFFPTPTHALSAFAYVLGDESCPALPARMPTETPPRSEWEPTFFWFAEEFTPKAWLDPNALTTT